MTISVGKLSGRQLAAIEIHLRETISVLDRCHGGVSFEQSPKERNVLVADLGVGRINAHFLERQHGDSLSRSAAVR